MTRPPAALIPTCALAAALVASTLPGCGQAPPPATPAALDDAKLRNVGELYRAYQINHSKPPRSARDLAEVASLTPSGYEAVVHGEVIVRWGASLPDTKEEPGGTPSPEVLAYLKTVPQTGGPVLLLDRTTRPMTAEEFKAANLAGTD
jgi:hypothetical protein